MYHYQTVWGILDYWETGIKPISEKAQDIHDHIKCIHNYTPKTDMEKEINGLIQYLS